MVKQIVGFSCVKSGALTLLLLACVIVQIGQLRLRIALYVQVEFDALCKRARVMGNRSFMVSLLYSTARYCAVAVSYQMPAASGLQFHSPDSGGLLGFTAARPVRVQGRA